MHLDFVPLLSQLHSRWPRLAPAWMPELTFGSGEAYVLYLGHGRWHVLAL
jgi:hypothetical protein